MACLSSSTRTRLLAQLETLEAQLDALNTTILSAYSDNNKSYTLDTGAGRQSATKRDLDSLEDSRSKLEAKINRLRNRLNFNTIVNLNLRRTRGGVVGPVSY